MAQGARERSVAAVRHFNRFYTQKIGILDEGHLRSDFSLTEVRVLYELANREKPTAAELSRELGLDPGYLSRVLRAFGTKGLVAREPSEKDGRQSLVRLTRRGQDAFAALDRRSSEEVSALLSRLSPARQRRLLEAMHTIEELLGGRMEPEKAPYLLRQHRPGDMGWVIQRHGVLYAQEYGWDERFEALVASIAAKFIQELDPKRERCWIAERDGENVGSVFLVQESKTVAKLRLLLVEPSARGLGIGSRLVDECVRFAREAGYRKVRLWTNDVLHAARRVYEQAGFVLVHSEPHHSFGHGLVGETWELRL
ncbi:bifunctional helix-turn-helix transcriptional regulator/GNAT family N-acetyltransferase [Pyxidicoccus fallax]|uniref:Bifunctional helix-turn-helix transcriptional regulator/GNAT family N-acetyltransferase n=1 Tax=Pyxidicoccus fallax TaxID=394095 RepID=A0A848LNW1_9BACT|nr:bifunctional helix-turn-helix transcriptional regulator/GNAT family N-acetyltransferase [Pyxidicoccus fallax]NMO19426.1 bifunctional helix-turn-helix transcriptional regulator/GNAT family N-acetyltransferase [Pyxidicoccus fallax]NPC81564.1 bifunctional helix-turn-helix transcriptional regulator/GNAT family N-acetyltransferase [Pyxidicoccus fallax]